MWFGLILGLSFIEAPLKFQAPGIDLPLGLGIGKLVFTVLNKIEIVCVLLLIYYIWRYPATSRTPTSYIWILTAIILIQSIFLLPILNERASQIIEGISLPHSYHHLMFVLLEIGKLVLLPLLFFSLHHSIDSN